jgi:hypothetical protein
VKLRRQLLEFRLAIGKFFGEKAAYCVGSGLSFRQLRKKRQDLSFDDAL